MLEFEPWHWIAYQHLRPIEYKSLGPSHVGGAAMALATSWASELA